MALSGLCPVCETPVPCGDDILESEILTCGDCLTSVVVESREGDRVVLAPAPTVDEDWGE